MKNPLHVIQQQQPEMEKKEINKIVQRKFYTFEKIVVFSNRENLSAKTN